MFRVWVFWTIIGLTLDHPINRASIKAITSKCGDNFKVNTISSSTTIDGPYITIVGIVIKTTSDATALCAERVLNDGMTRLIRAILVKQH